MKWAKYSSARITFLFCNETELKSLLYLLQLIVSERSTSICRSHTGRFHVNPISFFNTLNSPILITKLTAFILNIAEKTNKQCLRFRFIQEISWNQVIIILIQTFSLPVSLFFLPILLNQNYKCEYRASVRQLPVFSLRFCIDVGTLSKHERDIDIRHIESFLLSSYTENASHIGWNAMCTRLETPEYKQLRQTYQLHESQCIFSNQVDLGQIYRSKPLATLQMTFAVLHA